MTSKAAYEQWLRENRQLLLSMAHLTRDREIPVLSDMVAIAARRPLSPAQVDYARNIVDNAIADAWEEAHFLPEDDLRRAKAHFLGVVGQRITAHGVVARKSWVTTSYNERKVIVTINVSGEEAGAVLMISSSAKPFKALTRGDEITVTGEVRKHEDYLGVKQTQLGKAKIVEEGS